MLDLEAELDAVIGALSHAGIEYAVCGGLAMAIHGKPRATKRAFTGRSNRSDSASRQSR
jgi:hypothetical protein